MTQLKELVELIEKGTKLLKEFDSFVEKVKRAKINLEFEERKDE